MHIITLAVKILEQYMDAVANGSATFRELVGLMQLLRRLAFEVGFIDSQVTPLTSSPTTSQNPKPNGDTSSAPEGVAMVTDAPEGAGKAPVTTLAPEEAGDKSSVPHSRRVLIKHILRVVLALAYSPNGSTLALSDEEGRVLFGSLRSIFES